MNGLTLLAFAAGVAVVIAWWAWENHLSPDDRACDRCGDRVDYLSSDDLCDGCVEELASRALGAIRGAVVTP